MKENEFDSKVKGLFDQDSIPPIVKKRMNETYDRIEEDGKKNRKKRMIPFLSKKGSHGDRYRGSLPRPRKGEQG
jgi:hypothetical protein